MERNTGWLVRVQVCLAMLLAAGLAFGSSEPDQLKHLERSFSLHASLAALPPNGNWNTNFASLDSPTETQIQNAARLLTRDYNANRLYLIYQKEIPIVEAERVFQLWRQGCASDVEIVPGLILINGGTNRQELFSALEIQRLSEFFKREVNPNRIAISSVPGRQLSELSLNWLQTNFANGLVRLGVQPTEKLQAPFSGGVAQTLSALCSGGSNEEWQRDASGLQTLRNWIEGRNEDKIPITWNLAVVGCNHSKSETDPQFPQREPERNRAVLSGRNAMVVSEIVQHARKSALAGFSTELETIQLSSQAVNHDGSGYSFYEMLKRGQLYVGYYARPFLEIVNAYGAMRAGKAP